MVGDSGTTRQEDGGEDSNSRRYPSYYHCNTARNNRTNQQANSLNDLLTALIGVPPYEGTEPEIEANTEQEGEKGEEKDKKDKSEAPKEEDGETNKEKPLNQLEESSRPPLAKNLHHSLTYKRLPQYLTRYKYPSLKREWTYHFHQK